MNKKEGRHFKLPYVGFFPRNTHNKIKGIIKKLCKDQVSVNPNSIPYKILNVLKKDISKQLVDLFNLSLSSGVFPSLLNIAKVVPVHKKD